MGEESIAIRQAREARERGIKIGDGTLIWGALDNMALGGKPELITIGAHCLIAPHAQLLCHGYTHPEPIVIGDGCYIGWGSIILSGVTIGNNCVIGAGAVVARDVPDGMLAVGNPARVARPVDPEKHAKFLEGMRFFCTKDKGAGTDGQGSAG